MIDRRRLGRCPSNPSQASGFSPTRVAGTRSAWWPVHWPWSPHCSGWPTAGPAGWADARTTTP